MIGVNRIIPRELLLLAVAVIATACGGDPKWDYIDEGGNSWPVVDSVATTQGKVLLLTAATHWEHCAIKAAVNAIAPVATVHSEYNLMRHNPKYFFTRSQNEVVPTMCFDDGRCADTWGDIPFWSGINQALDGFYYNKGGYSDYRHEKIFVRGFEAPLLYDAMNFSRLLYVVIHEEVHGLGVGYSHGSEMDEIIDLIYSQASNDLQADPECRNIPDWTWERWRSAGTGDAVRRPVD